MPVAMKHPRPDCGITGWAAAWSILDRIDDDGQRNQLASLIRGAGFRGAPALRYCAQLARYLTGLSADYPPTPEKLTLYEAELVRRRLHDVLATLPTPGVFPLMRKLDG